MKSPVQSFSPASTVPASSGPFAARSATVWVLLVLILLAAGGLRIWRIGGVPDGLWVDEAIEGLQAEAMREGRSLPATPAIPYPRWPVWCGIEAVATRLGGNNPGTLRMPAGLAGVLGVGLAFLAGRAVAGSATGLGAAAFLAGSFWHVQYCRIALPCVLVVAEGLLVAWLLLGRRAPGTGAGCVLALLCLAAPYGYAASLVTPAAVILLLAVRWYGEPPSRPGRGFVLTMAVGAVMLAVALVLWRPESLRRTAELATGHRDPLIGQVVAWLNSVTWFTAPGWGFWRSYPPGAPRFAPIELALVVAGAAVLWWSGSPARWQKWGWTGWALLSVLPEWFGGEAPHLVRGLPQLAPAAVAAGIAVGALARRFGLWGPALVIALLSVNGGMTTHRLVARFARDPLVATWYLKPHRDATEGILAQASSGSIAVSPIFEYLKAPGMLFYLTPALKRGDIVMTNDPMGRISPVSVYDDPFSKQPAFVLFRLHARWKGLPRFLLMDMDQLFARGESAFNAGRLQEALGEFTRIVGLLQHSARARMGLGVTLLRMGRAREAIPHLEFALSCDPGDQLAAIIERELGRARAAAPAPIR